jgi:hypothetical protein
LCELAERLLALLAAHPRLLTEHLRLLSEHLRLLTAHLRLLTEHLRLLTVLLLALLGDEVLDHLAHKVLQHGVLLGELPELALLALLAEHLLGLLPEQLRDLAVLRLAYGLPRLDCVDRHCASSGLAPLPGLCHLRLHNESC